MIRFTASILPFKSLQLFCLIAIILPVLGMAQEDLKQTPKPEQIDEIFSEWNDPNKAGIAVGIVSNGEIVYKKGYGSANLEHNIPITTQTKFPVANMSDQFIAFSVLLLKEEGKLSLEDNIRKYLPEIRDFGSVIQIKHLLYHTSGLNPLSTLKQIAGWREGDAFSRQQAMDLINSQKKLSAIPGKLHHFDPSGLMLLEEIIARVSGQAYPDFVKTKIFLPLGMTASIFEKDGSDILANRATGYTLASGNYTGAKLSYSADAPSVLFTTIDDLCKWMINYNKVKVGKSSLLQELDKAALLNGQAVKPANAALKLGQYRMWDFKGTNKLYTIGMTDGYACKMVRFPAYDFSVVVLGNESSYNGYTSSNVADLYLENYYTSAPTEPVSPMKHIELSSEKLQAFCGSYWNPEGFYSRKIYLKNDTLRYLREENGFESDLLPIGEGRFQMQSWAKIIVSFPKKGESRYMEVIVNDEKPDLSVHYSPTSAWTNDLSIFTGRFYCEDLATSYTIKQDGNHLMVHHQRMEQFQLQPIVSNSFMSNKNFFKKIAFEFGENNVVQGFWLSSPGIDKIWFKSLDAKNIERVK